MVLYLTKKLSYLASPLKQIQNDTRETAAIQICKELIDEGAFLAIHDPKVEEENICNALKEINREHWEYVYDLNSAFKNADAIVILTEWQDYANLKWGAIGIQMRKPSWLFDARSIVNPS